MKVLINSVGTNPGGGFTNLVGLLNGWRRLDRRMDLVVLASNPIVIEKVRSFSDICKCLPVPTMNWAQRSIWETYSLSTIVSEHDPDVVLSNNFFSPLREVPQVVQHQNLFIWMQHTSRKSLRLMLQRTWARRSADRADRNVFISRYLMEQAVSISPDVEPKSLVVPYGLDSSVFFPDFTLDRPTFKLAAIQSPSAYKRNDILLKAFSELVRRNPNWPLRLNIVGPGDWSKWMRLASRLHIGDRVVWHGLLDDDGVADVLRLCDLLIHPSEVEAFGLPIVEAMACGVPVIAASIPAIHEIGGGAVHMVTPGDPSAIVDEVARVYNHAGAWSATRNAGLLQAQKYDWIRTAARFQDIFEQLV